MRNMSLKMRLVILILGMTLVSTISLTESSLILTRDQVLRDQTTILRNTATRMAANLREDLEARAAEVEFIVELPSLEQGELSSEEISELLRYVKDAYPHYAWVGLVDTQGTIIQDADNLLINASVAQRDWFIEGQKGTYFGDAHEAVLLAKLLPQESESLAPLRLVDISAPIKDDSGTTLYVLGTHLSLAWAREIQIDMLSQLNDPDVEILVLNLQGRLILDSDFHLEVAPEEMELFFQSHLSDQAELSTRVTLWPDGKEYLTVAMHSDAPVNSASLGWTVVARKPIDAVFEPAQVLARQLILISLVVFGVFTLLMWLAVKRSLKPLEEVAQLADRIRESETKAEIPEMQGNSEVARFVRSLAKLINDLSTKNQQLILADRMFFDNRLAIMVTDDQRRIVRVNRAFTEFTGFSEAEALGQKPSLLSSGRHSKEFYDAMNVSLLEHGSWRGEIWNRHKSGRIYPEFLTIIALTNDEGATQHYIAMFEDITEQKSQDVRLERLRNYDTLTKLPNRESAIRAVEITLKEADAESGDAALIFVDIAGFKNINEVYGHEEADQLLKQVARRLNSVVLESGYMARWGGDEFLICLRQCDLPKAKMITERLIDVMSSPFYLQEVEQHLRIHCGISLYPKDARNAANLLRFANIALLESKKHRNTPVLFYSSEMNDSIVLHMEIENALRNSVDNYFSGFELYYQPQFDGRTGKIKGLEALLRWHMKDRGPIGPDLFIPLAEANGLIEPIGSWVIKQACLTLSKLIHDFQIELTMSVNISGIQLQESRFIERLKQACNDSLIPRQLLIVEVTETAFMANQTEANQMLSDIRAAGFGVSIDDFGTGYASLDYIQRFKPTEIKIDRVFIQKMLTDDHCLNIVRFTLNLAESMNLEVVAEGVETQEQLDALNNMGKVIAQGYLLERPLPESQLLETLQSSR